MFSSWINGYRCNDFYTVKVGTPITIGDGKKWWVGVARHFKFGYAWNVINYINWD